MAKQATFCVGTYELGWLNGEACAVWWETPDSEHDPKRKRYRLGRTLKADGLAACRSALIAFAEGKERTKLKTNTTIEKVFDAYREYLKTEGKIETPAVTVWKHLQPAFGRLSPAEVTDAVCQEYAKSRSAAGASQGCVWTELNRLAASLNWASKKDLIKERFGLKNGGRVIWVPSKPPPRDKVLSIKEVNKLFDLCEQDHLFVFLALTVMGGGPRHTAVLELEWDRVDLEERWLNFKKPRQVDILHKGHQKHRAKVPMTDSLHAILTERQKSKMTRWVVEYNGGRVYSIKKAFAALAIKAGFWEERKSRATGKPIIAATVSPHTLRHSVATWLDKEGFTSDRIAKVIGHKDKRTTEQVYTHTEHDTLRPVVDKLDILQGRQLKVVQGGRR
jgi:integrase